MKGSPVSSVAAAKRQVYLFGPDRVDGRADMKELLGGKGANLAEMASLGLPVPPGFTITTEVCNAYYANGNAMPAPGSPGRGRKVSLSPAAIRNASTTSSR